MSGESERKRTDGKKNERPRARNEIERNSGGEPEELESLKARNVERTGKQGGRRTTVTLKKVRHYVTWEAAMQRKEGERGEGENNPSFHGHHQQRNCHHDHERSTNEHARDNNRVSSEATTDCLRAM